MTDVNTNTNNLFSDHVEDNTDYLAELVGEGKKFRDEKALAKGKWESDRMIAVLQTQLDEARTEVQKRIALEELKTAILDRDNGNNRGTVDTPHAETNTAVTADSIEELVRKAIETNKETSTKTANEQVVTETLTSVWGDNARVELANAAKELGLSVSKLGELGKENPKALFKLLGIGNQPVANGGSVPRSSVHVDNTNPSGDRTKRYYDKLKAENPRSYWDKRIQVQMNKDAMRLKEAFYN